MPQLKLGKCNHSFEELKNEEKFKNVKTEDISKWLGTIRFASSFLTHPKAKEVGKADFTGSYQTISHSDDIGIFYYRFYNL